MTVALKQNSTQEKREKLRKIIENVALSTGEAVTTTSGLSTSFYFDMRPLGLHGDSAALVGELMAEKLNELQFDSFGGMESGAIPITAAIAASWAYKKEARGFFVRKKEREHGKGKRIEGNFKSGDTVVMIEDVATTGGSIIKAADAIREMGGNVIEAIVIVDRMQGAEEHLAEAGIKLHSLFKRDEFEVKS